MHHILLRRRFDILIAHRLDSLLLRFELVFENLQLHPILRYLSFLLIQCTSQFSHLILDSFFISLEKANFFGIQLVVFALLFDGISPSVKCLFLHIKSFDLFLKLIVQVHDLSLLFIKFSLSLFELSLLNDKVSALVLSLFKFFP